MGPDKTEQNEQSSSPKHRAVEAQGARRIGVYTILPHFRATVALPLLPNRQEAAPAIVSCNWAAAVIQRIVIVLLESYFSLDRYFIYKRNERKKKSNPNTMKGSGFTAGTGNNR